MILRHHGTRALPAIAVMPRMAGGQCLRQPQPKILTSGSDPWVLKRSPPKAEGGGGFGVPE
jgi:hypothetical protein